MTRHDMSSAKKFAYFLSSTEIIFDTLLIVWASSKTDVQLEPATNRDISPEISDAAATVFNVLPFILLLSTSAILSFLLWKKGSLYAKYLCISFALPFLSAPISGLAYLFYDFNWITWLIINSAVGILFLGMFITFGFAVAQQLNDMKLLALQQQVKLTEAYQRFVPQQLLKNLGKDSILDVSLGDQVNVEMSILFSDIRSFTSISEKMTPKEIEKAHILIDDYKAWIYPFQ